MCVCVCVEQAQNPNTAAQTQRNWLQRSNVQHRLKKKSHLKGFIRGEMKKKEEAVIQKYLTSVQK